MMGPRGDLQQESLTELRDRLRSESDELLRAERTRILIQELRAEIRALVAELDEWRSNASLPPRGPSIEARGLLEDD